ncbi:Low affinity immunoglobulin epsilon Fc receptor [Bagarius yarrelli]|nr:Low affinity immunoglobulin epsilon Fc receptor [Bagarius yarrelli]
MSLFMARYYCRDNHGHLATITTKEEYDKCSLMLLTILAWIGLKRTAPGEINWQWPNSEITSFTKWGSAEPNGQYRNEDCVVMDMNGWRDTTCLSGSFAALCTRSFTLVKEKKTWDEALRHCRSHYTDLAFVKTSKQIEFFKTFFKNETETDSVWTGMRFLDGKWFWVNEGTLASQVPLSSLCPIHPFRCGSYNFNTLSLENSNCDEKFNFVCYY